MFSCLPLWSSPWGSRTDNEPANSLSDNERRSIKLRQISDHIYDFREHNVEKPNATFLFIHSLCVDPNQLSNAYYTTWERKGSGGTECWPSTLLANSFPDARILTAKVDLSAMESDVHGRSDLDRMTNNLVVELITSCSEPLGQQEGPVILVTHGLGALVAQKFVLAAVERLRSTNPKIEHEKSKLKAFLNNLRGLFYYSPIFAGSKELSKLTDRVKMKGPTVKYVEVLSNYSAREVREFVILRDQSPFRQNLMTMAAVEQFVTRTSVFSAQVVSEGTANIGIDRYASVAADHVGVCQPEKTTSNSFVFLENFIHEIMDQRRDSE